MVLWYKKDTLVTPPPLSQEKDDLRLKIIRSEIGNTNSVGSNAARYFKHLSNFLAVVQEDIMLLPWNLLKDVADPSGGERKRDSLVRCTWSKAHLH